MTPALTKEEWTRHPSHQIGICCGLVWASLEPADSREVQMAGTGEVEADGEMPPHLFISWQSVNDGAVVGRRHALAALCLHGQPYGFTREDVRKLREAGQRHETWGHGEGGTPDEMDARLGRVTFANLASRIESLLPPEDAP